eukprot:5616776-Pleurochrysis_carterae.AAC.1
MRKQLKRIGRWGPSGGKVGMVERVRANVLAERAQERPCARARVWRGVDRLLGRLVLMRIRP